LDYITNLFVYIYINGCAPGRTKPYYVHTLYWVLWGTASSK